MSSIEETNAQRAKLGLRPLRAAKSALAAAPAPAPESLPKRQKIQKSDFDLSAATEGEVLILEDRGVLEDDDGELLVRPTPLEKKKTATQNLISKLVQQQQQEEEEEAKPVLGAKLFVSDAAVPSSALAALVESKKKPKRAKMVAQVKIDRTAPTGEKEAGDGEEDELDRLLLSIRPKAQVSESSAFQPEKEEEDLVPMSSIGRLQPVIPSNLAPQVVLPLPTPPTTTAAPLAHPASPPPSLSSSSSTFHRRSLSTTLQMLSRFGNDDDRDELVVGRTKDTRPVANLNKPGDLVQLEYRDDHGRKLTTKEAYRQLKYQFRGDGPGPRKKMLREQQLAKKETSSSFSAKDLVRRVNKDHVVLWKGN
ncbi:hypothetical protein BASA81_012639 [Batrachochytrium salamandrivorans]|nr:hypothetical protein BASA81_012639 [Batrachochytrium salamandrivorans]